MVFKGMKVGTFLDKRTTPKTSIAIFYSLSNPVLIGWMIKNEAYTELKVHSVI